MNAHAQEAGALLPPAGLEPAEKVFRSDPSSRLTFHAPHSKLPDPSEPLRHGGATMLSFGPVAVPDSRVGASLSRMLGFQGEHRPGAPAILAPGRAPLSYGRLLEHVQEVGGRLRELGIRRGDRVALVLPNGPETATAFLAVAAAATCAPLNPAYRSGE